jgi:hypothetical protein
MTDGSCLLVCASPENIPWNTVWPCGLASVEQIKSLTHVGLGEQDHSVGALMHGSVLNLLKRA